MKIKRFFLIFIITLCTICALAATAVLLLSNDRIFNYFSRKYLQKLELESGYKVEYSDFTSNSFRNFDITDFSLSVNDKTVVSASSINISASLYDCVLVLLKSKVVSFDFRCSDLNVDLDIDSLPAAETTDADSDNGFLLDYLKKFSGNISSERANVRLVFNDSVLSVNNLSFELSFRKDFNIRKFKADCTSVELASKDGRYFVENVAFDSESDSVLNFSLNSVSVGDFNISGLCGSFNLEVEDNRIKSVNLRSDSILCKLSGYKGFDFIELDDLSATVSVNEKSEKRIEILSSVKGHYQDERIDSFGFDLFAATDFNSVNEILVLENYVNADLEISDFYCKILEEGNSISISSDDYNTFTSSFTLSDSIVGNITFSLNSKETSVRLYIQDLLFADYEPLFELIEHYVGSVADEESKLNGSIVYNGNVDLSNLNGMLSINLVGQNFNFADKKQTLALTLEASAENNILDIGSFAVSAMGKRLSYSGRINLSNYFPEGNLILQDTATFNELVRVVFNLDADKLGYSFNAIIPDSEDFNLTGHVNFSDKKYILADMSVDTAYHTYPFDFIFDLENMVFDIKSDDAFMNAHLKDNIVEVTGSLKELPLYFSDRNPIVLSSDLYADYHIDDSDYTFYLNNSEIKISDILSFNLNLLSDKTHTAISDLSVLYTEELYDFDGKIEVSYNSIEDLIDFNQDNVVFKVDMTRSNSDNYIKGSFFKDTVYLDSIIDVGNNIVLKVLGNINNGIYANIVFDDIEFNAEYQNGNISVENGEGLLNSFRFDDFDINLDFINRKFFSSFKFINRSDNYGNVIEQGGTIEVSAQLDSLVVGALNFAGIEADASFELSIIDGYLGDGFNLTDTVINVTYSRSNIKLEGDIINGYILPNEKYIDINIDKSLLFGFNAKGYYDDNFEILLSDIYFPLPLIDRFLNTPFYTTYGGIIEGDLLVNGNFRDPSFYGMLYAQAFDMGLLYIPMQELSLKNVVISAVDHSFYISRIPVVGHSNLDGRYYDGNVSVEVVLGALSLESMNLYLDVPGNPIDLWVPLVLDSNNDLDIRGDVTGNLHFYYENGLVGLDADITADNTTVTFRIEDKPEWMDEMEVYLDTNVILTTGKNVEFYYPNKNNAFINFTVDEGDTVNIIYKMDNEELFADGSFDIKSGRISYINNDFSITEGKCRLSKNLNGEFDFNIDLLANIKEYDYDGNRMDIYLTLTNANLNNINPRFSSNPNLSENEILQVLASSVLPSKKDDFTFSNIANLALVAARAVSNLGLMDDLKDFSLNDVVRDSLMLDVFAARSAILENIVLSSITDNKDVSLLAQYLNGTSLFAGKYIGNNWFARMSMLLRSSSYKDRKSGFGHFLTNDLIIDYEFSFEWDNPFGEFAVFTKPQELSVFDFLDTIGISVTKRFSF